MTNRLCAILFGMVLMIGLVGCEAPTEEDFYNPPEWEYTGHCEPPEEGSTMDYKGWFQCNDKNPCTVDGCTRCQPGENCPDEGKCHHEPTGACNDPEVFEHMLHNDDLTYTMETGNTSFYTPVEAPTWEYDGSCIPNYDQEYQLNASPLVVYEANGHCEDNNPCTGDYCSDQHLCIHETIQNCTAS